MRASPVNPQLVTSAEADVVAVLLQALDQTQEPVTAKDFRRELTGPFKLPEGKLAATLDYLVEQGRVVRYAPIRANAKNSRYWTRDQHQYARRIVTKELSRKGPKPWRYLNTRLNATLKGISKDQIEQVREGMLADRQLFEWPPLGTQRVSKYSVEPPDPKVYLAAALEKTVGKLNKAGVGREQMARAALELLGVEAKALCEPPASREELGQRIIERMQELVPAAANGALVSIRDLRRSLDFQVANKAAFDEAVLWLAAEGRVALHRHDFPLGLSTEERAEMVPDGHGGFYIGIAFRV
jgi:DNA-binding MarR family transcriptional regulator